MSIMTTAIVSLLLAIGAPPVSPASRLQQWRGPAPDSVRTLVAREFPDVVGRPKDSEPVLVLLLADANGRISHRKRLPLRSSYVPALGLLEKEFALKQGQLVGASVMVLEGTERPARGALWAVFGQTR